MTRRLLGRDCGFEENRDGIAGCGGDAGVAVHAGGELCSVVEDVELLAELAGVGRAGLACEAGEQVAPPGAVLGGVGFDDPAGRGFAACRDKSASPEKPGSRNQVAWLSNTARIFSRGSSCPAMAPVSLVTARSRRRARYARTSASLLPKAL